MKKLNISICVFAAVLALSGCNRRVAPTPIPSLPLSTPAENNPMGASPLPTPGPTQTTEQDLAALTALLPSETGYDWDYSGYAEYVHEMKLDSLEKTSDQWVYNISGQVFDVSEGEGRGDPSIYLTYVVDGEKILQRVQSVMMMDSEFKQIEIIRLPLAKGALWEQTVPKNDGSLVTLECRIDDIAMDNGKQTYTVSYTEPSGEHKERRIIREGTGVVYYEKLFPQGEELQGMSYALLEASDDSVPQLSPHPAFTG
jgi:hypothetical protein